jgi:hypothetical protein
LMQIIGSGSRDEADVWRYLHEEQDISRHCRATCRPR